MLNRSLYIFVSKMFSYGTRILLPYFLVRLLTKTEFGTYRQFFLLQALITALFQFGLNQGLFYFVPRNRERASTYFVNTLFLNLCIFGTTFLLIRWRLDDVSGLLHMAVLRDFFPQLAVYTVLIIFIVAGDSFLLAQQKVLPSVLAEVGGTLLTAGLTLAAAFRTRDLETIIMALLLGRSLHLLFLGSYIHFRLAGFHVYQFLDGLREQVRYSIVLGLGGTLGTLVLRFHELFVSRFYGPAGYAVYSAGCTELPVLQLYMQSVAMVALGQFALLEKQRDWEGIRRLWREVTVNMYAVGVPVILLLLLVSKPLILFLFTEKYAAAIAIFRINTLVKLNFLLNATLVLRAVNRNDITVKTHLTMLLVAPFILYVGMKVAGMVGIIAAHALLYVGGRFALMNRLNRITGLHLIYVPPVREVLGFYRSLPTRATQWWRNRLASQGETS